MPDWFPEPSVIDPIFSLFFTLTYVRKYFHFLGAACNRRFSHSDCSFAGGSRKTIFSGRSLI